MELLAMAPSMQTIHAISSHLNNNDEIKILKGNRFP